MGNKTKSKSYNQILSEMNARELSEIAADRTIAILIFGACENHGDHMPFGADFIMPFELAKRLARKYHNLIVFPPMPYGVSSHHKDFFMTTSLEPETMIAVIHDILQSLVNNNKITRILIINGHDGNIPAIELASRKIKEQHPEVTISCLESWWTLVGALDRHLFDVWNGLGHGGEAETSAMLAVRPDLVDMSLAPKQVVPKLPGNNSNNNTIRIYWSFKELTDTGTTGAPQKATAQKGERILELLEEVLLAFIEEMDRSQWKYGWQKKQ
jgi:creatinine amidohydrolase